MGQPFLMMNTFMKFENPSFKFFKERSDARTCQNQYTPDFSTVGGMNNHPVSADQVLCFYVSTCNTFRETLITNFEKSLFGISKTKVIVFEWTHTGTSRNQYVAHFKQNSLLRPQLFLKIIILATAWKYM